MKIAFKTFGCRANHVDTDMLHFQAQRKGFDVVPDTQFADAYIINSCTVTENADKSTHTQVRRFRQLNPQAIVGVVGCYPQVSKESLLNDLGINIILGTSEKQRVFELVKQHLGQGPQNEVTPAKGYLAQEFLGSLRARASIKIQDGCNYRCSYCIIPKARGRSKSVPSQVALNQIQQAYAMGFEEVVLTGIHLAHYGWEHNTNLYELISEVLSWEKGPRVRLSTLDPFEISDELIKLTSQSSRFCPYFHIALQSGDNHVLKHMRRLYRAEEFKEICEKIKASNPDTYIGADVIVGFPKEDEASFEKTVQFLDQTPWTKLHVFPYSLRKDTEAAQWEDHIPLQEKERRSQIVRAMSDERLLEFSQSQLGKTKNVLFERQREDGMWLGHTENYLPTLTLFAKGERKKTYPVELKSIEEGFILTNPLV